MTISTNLPMGLVDTNVLVYRADRDSEFHQPSANLIQQGLKGEIPLCVSLQNLTEFYAVITSPKRVTNPITPAEASAEIKKYLQSNNIRKIYQTMDVL
jgi:predicted nucleic acid-binding protein